MEKEIIEKKPSFKGSKGPWHAVNYAGWINIQRSPYYGSKNLLDESKNPNAEHDAALMRAAPDLLKAAESAILELQIIPCKCNAKVIRQLEKAVNKALNL